MDEMTEKDKNEHYVDQADASLLLWQALEEDNENDDQPYEVPFQDLDLDSVPVKMGENVQDITLNVENYDVKSLPLCVRHAILAAKIAEDPDSWNLYCYIKMSQAAKKKEYNIINGLYHNIDKDDIEDYVNTRINLLNSEDYYYPDEINDIEESAALPADIMDYTHYDPFLLADRTEFLVHTSDNREYRDLLDKVSSKTLHFKDDYEQNAAELLHDIGYKAAESAVHDTDYLKNGITDVRLFQDGKKTSQRLLKTRDVLDYFKSKNKEIKFLKDSSGKFLKWAGMSSYRLRYGAFIAARHLREALRNNIAIKFVRFKYMSSSDASAAVALLNQLEKPFIFSYDKGYNILCCSHEQFLKLFVKFQITKKKERSLRDYEYAEKIRHYLLSNPEHDIQNWFNGKNLDGTAYCEKFKRVLKKAEEKKNRNLLRNKIKLPNNHPRKCRLACYCVSVTPNDIAYAGILTTMYNGKIKMREKASRCLYCRTLYYGVCDNAEHEVNKKKYIKELYDYYGYKPRQSDFHQDCYPILTMGTELKWLGGNMFTVTQQDLDGLVIQIVFDCDKIQTDIPVENFPSEYQNRIVPIARRCHDCVKFTDKAFVLQETNRVEEDITIDEINARIIGELRLPQFPQRDDIFAGEHREYEQPVTASLSDEYGDYVQPDISEFNYNPVSPDIPARTERNIIDMIGDDEYDVRGEKRKLDE